MSNATSVVLDVERVDGAVRGLRISDDVERIAIRGEHHCAQVSWNAERSATPCARELKIAGIVEADAKRWPRGRYEDQDRRQYPSSHGATIYPVGTRRNPARARHDRARSPGTLRFDSLRTAPHDTGTMRP